MKEEEKNALVREYFRERYGVELSEERAGQKRRALRDCDAEELGRMVKKSAGRAFMAAHFKANRRYTYHGDCYIERYKILTDIPRDFDGKHIDWDILDENGDFIVFGECNQDSGPQQLEGLGELLLLEGNERACIFNVSSARRAVGDDFVIIYAYWRDGR